MVAGVLEGQNASLLYEETLWTIITEHYFETITLLFRDHYHQKLLAFLETSKLLSDHQYGFRQARSIGDLLAYAADAWSSALECYGESRVISLDISKAFDRLWHKGLLAKLPMFGLHNTFWSSLHGYLAFYLIGQLQLGLILPL